MKRCPFCSLTFSWSCRATNIMSIIPRSLLKYLCDSRQIPSTMLAFSLSNIILVSTLRAADKNELPLLFSHIAWSPFFLYIENIRLFIKSCGIVSASHVALIRSNSLSRRSFPENFSISAGILLRPEDDSFFKEATSTPTSARVGASGRPWSLFNICGSCWVVRV